MYGFPGVGFTLSRGFAPTEVAEHELSGPSLIQANGHEAAGWEEVVGEDDQVAGAGQCRGGDEDGLQTRGVGRDAQLAGQRHLPGGIGLTPIQLGQDGDEVAKSPPHLRVGEVKNAGKLHANRSDDFGHRQVKGQLVVAVHRQALSERCLGLDGAVDDPECSLGVPSPGDLHGTKAADEIAAAGVLGRRGTVDHASPRDGMSLGRVHALQVALFRSIVSRWLVGHGRMLDGVRVGSVVSHLEGVVTWPGSR